MIRRSNLETLFRANRPPGNPTRLDQQLLQLVNPLHDALAETQERLSLPIFQLDNASLDNLTLALVEFGEDIHARIGFWRELEKYQTARFGVPLPLILRPGEALNESFDFRRVQYFLYVLWRQFKPDLVIAPNHRDLVTLATKAADFFATSFAALPRESSVVRFLHTPNRRGWDVKKKLVWTGLHSYLFRDECIRYLDTAPDDMPKIDRLDAFICEECTGWSGLGVIDLLAETLDLPDTDRATLRTWYNPHHAGYLITSHEKLGPMTETIHAVNVVNDQVYRIRMEIERCPFAQGQLILGALTPWRGEWYWSGGQRIVSSAGPEIIASLKKDFIEKTPAISYCYCPNLLQRARDSVQQHHRDFVAHYGDNLVVFADGLAAAASEQKRLRLLYEQQPHGIVDGLMEKFGLRNRWPDFQYPDRFLNHANGIAAFFNPEEGLEFMSNFNAIQAALAKQDEELSDEESVALQNIIESDCVSPAFLQRVLRDYSTDAIGRSYLISNFQSESDLAYLLRRFKGRFFRNRYPNLALRQGDVTP